VLLMCFMSVHFCIYILFACILYSLCYTLQCNLLILLYFKAIIIMSLKICRVECALYCLFVL